MGYLATLWEVLLPDVMPDGRSYLVHKSFNSLPVADVCLMRLDSHNWLICESQYTVLQVHLGGQPYYMKITVDFLMSIPKYATLVRLAARISY
ncbi:hypothetical protein NC653_016026 [Populus alba x Populus x berolinensis]|uniref:Uncharacterized protein n=1 Tax=Populus alba x Populus x berolinensis TaxID=444605 RepID=A0AAD6QLU1_9ROSI|nr:hypothetical protein NC653_016026 [Populus alba x Populus x berolinensis]